MCAVTMELSAPQRSLVQRQEALAKANAIRSERARCKRDLKAGRVGVASLVNDPPAWLLSAKVFDVLMAAPKMGRVKVSKVLAQVRVSPSKTVGGLSARQRGELVGLLLGVPHPTLTAVDRGVLECMRLAPVALFADTIGHEVGIPARNLGSRLGRLSRLGLIVAEPVEDCHAAAWVLTDAGREELERCH